MKKKIIAMMLSIMTLSQLGAKEANASTNFYWTLQTGTALHETDSNWKFLLGDYNKDKIDDLYCINKSKEEIHILNGADKFKSFLLQVKIPLGGGDWDFDISDYNNDGYLDVYGISKSQTGSKTTEVHVLNGKNQFQSFLLHTKTALHETGSDWQFLVGDANRDGSKDLYAINSKGEVHILNGSNNFQSFYRQVTTKLGSSQWDFGLNDYNGDGYLDLYSIAKTNTGSGKTELHVLNGSNMFQSFLLQKATHISPTNSSWQFLVGSGEVNIYGIKKNGTGTKTTEVHQFKNVASTNQISARDKVVNEARKHLGKRYEWGATGPNSFDCSGLTQYVYKQALGIDITRTTYTQINQGKSVSQSQLLPGDLVFTSSGHVGIYIGNNQMIHAPQTGDVVKISNIWSFYAGRRIIN